MRSVKVSLLMLGILFILLAGDRVSAQVQGCPSCNYIGDRVWFDTNGNGIFEEGPPNWEQGLAGVKVEAVEVDANGVALRGHRPFAYSNVMGGYSIEIHPETWYRHRLDTSIYQPIPYGLKTLTKDNRYNDDYVDSDPYEVRVPPDPNRPTGWTEPFFNPPGGDTTIAEKWDIGYTQMSFCGDIGNTIWRDSNGNGELDDGESGIGAATVELYRLDVTDSTWEFQWQTTTDASGQYHFYCVPTGESLYTIAVRNVGMTGPSLFYDPDVANLEDNDNNGISPREINYDESLPREVVAVTPSFFLGQNHPHIDNSIDIGLFCDPAPLDMVLVIDTSDSMAGEPLAKAKSAAVRFLDYLRPQDRGAVLGFDDDLQWGTHLTSSKTELIAGINALAQGVFTNTKIAISAAAQELSSGSSAKVIVLLTDGTPQLDNVPANKAIEARLALVQATLAKANGIHILAVGVGRTTESFLKAVVSDPATDYHKAGDISEIEDAFRRIPASLCASAGPEVRLPCTGREAVDIDLSTGAHVGGGQDTDWVVGIEGQQGSEHQAYAVDTDGDWYQLPKSKWISVSSSAFPDQPQMNYVYKRTFSLPGEPSHVVLEASAFVDDRVKSVDLNGSRLLGDWGGGPKTVTNVSFRPSQASLLNSTNELVFTVRDALYKTGLDVRGRIRACVPLGGPSPQPWRPTRTCDESSWRLERVPARPDIDFNPANPDEIAFCMSITEATWIGSRVLNPPQGSGCWTAGVVCVGPGPACSNNHYRFPHCEEFDLGLMHYAAANPSTYTSIPNYHTTNHPVQFIIYADAEGPYYPQDQHWIHADLHYDYNKAGQRVDYADRLERYLSLCRTGGTNAEYGILVPMDQAGFTHADSYQWVKVIQETAPFTCGGPEPPPCGETTGHCE
jgi:hypothetical protein